MQMPCLVQAPALRGDFTAAKRFGVKLPDGLAEERNRVAGAIAFPSATWERGETGGSDHVWDLEEIVVVLDWEGARNPQDCSLRSYHLCHLGDFKAQFVVRLPRCFAPAGFSPGHDLALSRHERRGEGGQL